LAILSGLIALPPKLRHSLARIEILIYIAGCNSSDPQFSFSCSTRRRSIRIAALLCVFSQANSQHTSAGGPDYALKRCCGRKMIERNGAEWLPSQSA
jgi:hypothetical protein